MVVEFRLQRAPSVRVACIVRVGPWREDNLRTEFGELTRWAKHQRLSTGRWIFVERDHHRWEACLEFRGSARAEGRVRLKMLPATLVARVVFDPDQVSSSVVYHGLNDWTRSQRREGKIGSVTGIREVYSADPWSDPVAWANCEVQFTVRSL
ncbi:MAG: GyrI-like domain-containing protein [Thermoplasmata archaeon]|jgi:hypothetical protein|nr:GyrI-like domain-containing protein [Thermoplasmata archaeon]